jgi:cytosine/adenosine deaminase-related metal-dependent hydrolase
MLLAAEYLVPIATPWIRDGAVLVKKGAISDVGPLQLLKQRYPGEPITEYRGAALMPGFVNVHTHLELTVFRGYLENLAFWDWLRKLVLAKHQILSPEDFRWSALWGAAECIRAGITTIGDAMDLGSTMEALIQSGLRGIAYQEVFGKDPAEAQKALAALDDKMDCHKKRLAECSLNRPDSASASNLIQLGVSPHSTYIVSPALLKESAAYARGKGYPVSIHAAESEAESLFLNQGEGPIAGYYKQQNVPWSVPGVSAISYLDRLGVLDDRTQLVHCIHLAEQDFEILAARKVRVAHCPKSNAKLGNGRMQLLKMRSKGISVGLGSDSVASNNLHDLFEEMRLALFLAKANSAFPPVALTAADMLRIATLGGAEALGMDQLIGSIEKGKQADLIVVGLDEPHTLPVFDPVESLVYSALAFDVRMTMVAGQKLWESGEFHTLDISENSSVNRVMRDSWFCKERNGSSYQSARHHQGRRHQNKIDRGVFRPGQHIASRRQHCPNEEPTGMDGAWPDTRVR